MNQRNGIPLATTPPLRQYRVLLEGGDEFIGTKQQIMERNSSWWPYAQEVVQSPQPMQSQSSYEDALTLIQQVDQDWQDSRNPGRLPNSSRTYNPVPGKKKIQYEYQPEVIQTNIKRRRSAEPVTTAPYETEDIPQGKPKRQKRSRSFFRLPKHPVLYLGIGMIVMLALWNALSYGLSWWQLHQDDSTYGRPRTAQYDVVVGHNDSPMHKTHIIALNLNAHIVIIELPGGDTSKSRIYSGPVLYGSDADLAPITLTFRDTTGTGPIDIIVHFQGGQLIYLNRKVNGVWQFVPPTTSTIKTSPN